MPRKPDQQGESPRTDLPPEREPYYEGYFGTEEEEGVVREEESGDDDEGGPGKNAKRESAEDAAGGDRGLE